VFNKFKKKGLKMIRAITIKGINFYYSYTWDYKKLIIQAKTNHELQKIKAYLKDLLLPFELISDPNGSYIKTSHSILDIKKLIELNL
jgi:hypothetical protein